MKRPRVATSYEMADISHMFEMSDGRHKLGNGRRLPQVMKWLMVATSYEIAEGRQKLRNVRRLPQVMKWPKVATSYEMAEDCHKL